MSELTQLFEMPYLPPRPKHYNPPIGLIGCGGITPSHLKAYREKGYRVVAMCDLILDRALRRREEYYPDAEVCEDYRELLKRDDIEVVDVTTHPIERTEIIADALIARKHVLSQKPFVVDLDLGEQLIELAERKNVQLAVNQNGRWAPHFSYMRHAIAAGLLGEANAAHLSVHWNHGWVAGTEFEKVKHLILFDYAIHWFDIVRCLLPGHRAVRVYASTARSRSQNVWPHLLGQALLEFDGAQASLAFDGDTRAGSQDRTYVAGSQGSIMSLGPGNRVQQVTMMFPSGHYQPELKGHWFPDAFAGPMGELLSSIEEKRTPSTSARDNLESLALCFAAVASAETHVPCVPGSVRRLMG